MVAWPALGREVWRGREANLRLCVLYSLELLVRQVDCGAPDADPHASEQVYAKLHAMFTPLQAWADKPELMVAATQLLALIVCVAPAAFWQAHMDVSKEAKKVQSYHRILLTSYLTSRELTYLS